MKKQTLDLALLEQFFTENYTAHDFLETLHTVMVNHVCACGPDRHYVNKDMLAEDIEFLDTLYRTVRKAYTPHEAIL